MATRKKTTKRTSKRPAKRRKKGLARATRRRSAGGGGAKKRGGSAPTKRAAVRAVKRATPTERAAARTVKRAAPAAASNPSGLAEGDSVPAFELPDQDGELVSSDSLRGQPYVLYFYPKDDTPGCTKEACGFRDDVGKFRERGVRVIGVSPDKPESHVRFQKKYGLNFTLLSDVDKALIQACGVWVKKQNYGREYMGVERSTFLVGGDGKVQKVWRRVRVDGHVADVLGAA